ncbi:MAG: DUF368 domain-containing protein, partial [Parachlamydia sp.]|nr:DUF368 domain-containing protein [Parachlamydia sp.]
MVSQCSLDRCLFGRFDRSLVYSQNDWRALEVNGNSRIKLFFCGLCMGAADLIPGISGGTIAFIMGFYSQLLESLKSINRANLQLLFKGEFKNCFEKTGGRFLLPLMAGIATAILSLSRLIDALLSHEAARVYLYACFFGLILASFVYCIKQINSWSWRNAVLLLIGISVAYPLTKSSNVGGPYSAQLELDGGKEAVNYDAQKRLLSGLSTSDIALLVRKKRLQQEDLIYGEEGKPLAKAGDFVPRYQIAWLNGWLILCGSLAVFALLLPGLSGSYILTLLGAYPLVIGAVSDLTTGLLHASLPIDALGILVNVLMGILVG